MNQSFESRTYGRRLTLLFVVQTVAIWISIGSLAGLILQPVVSHGAEFDLMSQLAIGGGFAMGLVFQALAIMAWQKVDRRKVVWNPNSKTVTVFEHRIFSRFFSLGSVRPQIDLHISEIESMKLQKQQGAQLRLHTSKGFICLTNDLKSFKELCQLLHTEMA